MKMLKDLLAIVSEQEEEKEKTKKSSKPKPDEDGEDGLEKKFDPDRPFPKKPKRPQYTLGNMFVNMVKSGPLAGTVKLGESFEQIKSKIANFVISDLGKSYTDFAQRIDHCQSYRDLIKVLDNEEMSMVYVAKGLSPAEQDELQAGVDRELFGNDQEDEEAGTRRYGLTKISPRGKYITIVHTGNMGNTVENSVKPNVDKILGLGAFNFLKKHGKIYKDKVGNVHDDPSYSYVLNVPVEYYTDWMNKSAPTKGNEDEEMSYHEQDKRYGRHIVCPDENGRCQFGWDEDKCPKIHDMYDQEDEEVVKKLHKRSYFSHAAPTEAELQLKRNFKHKGMSLLPPTSRGEEVTEKTGRTQRHGFPVAYKIWYEPDHNSWVVSIFGHIFDIKADTMGDAERELLSMLKGGLLDKYLRDDYSVKGGKEEEQYTPWMGPTTF